MLENSGPLRNASQKIQPVIYHHRSSTTSGNAQPKTTDEKITPPLFGMEVKKFFFSQKTPKNEEPVARYGNTNDLYMPLSFILVSKRKKQLINARLDLRNGLTKDASVDSRAFVCANVGAELDRINRLSTTIIFEIDNLANFQLQVAND